MATANGTVKKTPLEEFQNIRRNGLIAIKLSAGNSLKWVQVTNGEDQIVLVSRDGKSIRFDEGNVRSMGRNASGVR